MSRYAALDRLTRRGRGHQGRDGVDTHVRRLERV